MLATNRPDKYVNWSGLLAELAELQTKVAALEASGVGVGKRIVFGFSEVEWEVKGFTSANKEIVTGLTEIISVLCFPKAPSIAMGYITVVSGVATVRARSVEELPAGTKNGFYWIAIGK